MTPGVPEPYRWLPGDGPPLLLIHGLGGTWRTWEPVLGALTGSCSVLAPTLPGHWGGLPEPVGRVPTAESAADAMEILMDSLGIDTAHVVAHSIGAVVALELMRRRRTRSLSMLCPGLAWPGVGQRIRLAYRLIMSHLVARTVTAGLKVGGTSGLVDRWVFHLAANARGKPISAEEMVLLQGLAHCHQFIGIVLLMALRVNPRPLPSPRGPVQVIWSENDDMVLPDRFRAALLHRIGAASEVTVSGTTHLLVNERPELVALLILRHVSASREVDRR